MTNFMCADISSLLDKTDIFNILSSDLADFKCRMGESDAQGGYVSGTNKNRVRIQCWTGENPMQLTVSFSSTNLNSNEREEILGKIARDIIPRIGEVIKVRDV